MKRSVEIRSDGVYLDQKKFFLVSGDMHYFRILPEDWERRLMLMKDFGLTAVTTYVPWNLTEPKRGEYCFEGHADLCRFFELCDKIRPYLHTNGGPIILVGLENEYGTFLYNSPTICVSRSIVSR